MVFGGKIIRVWAEDVSGDRTKLFHKVCDQEKEEQGLVPFHYNPGKYEKMAVNLMYTCREIFQFTWQMPYHDNTWFFNDPKAFMTFLRKTEASDAGRHKLNSIRSLRFEIKHDNYNAWDICFVILPHKCRKVTDVTVVVEYNIGRRAARHRYDGINVLLLGRVKLLAWLGFLNRLKWVDVHLVEKGSRSNRCWSTEEKRSWEDMMMSMIWKGF